MAIRKSQPQPAAPWGAFVPGVGMLTPEAFAQFHGDERWQYELYHGRLLRMPGPGGEHGRIQMTLGGLLRAFVHSQHLSTVFGTACFIFAFPDGTESVMCPDLSFVLADRAAAAPYRGSYQVLVPDFVAEIVSPNDTRPEVQEKVAEYLRAGVRLIWTLWPKTRTVEVWDGAATGVIIAGTATLDAGAVLPGFTCTAAKCFA